MVDRLWRAVAGPVAILGGGSNLRRGRGLRGLVIEMCELGIEERVEAIRSSRRRGRRPWIRSPRTVSADTPGSKCLSESRPRGRAVQNVGAYGQEGPLWCA
jgi:hypothetical protein